MSEVAKIIHDLHERLREVERERDALKEQIAALRRSSYRRAKRYVRVRRVYRATWGCMGVIAVEVEHLLVWLLGWIIKAKRWVARTWPLRRK